MIALLGSVTPGLARHLIEDFSGKLRELKRIAIRVGKTDQGYTAMIYLAAALIHSR